jgi:putative ABC transport system permease protein
VGVARLDQAAVDGWVLGFTAIAAIATALVFGLAPAWQSSGGVSAVSLHDGGRGATSGSVAGRRVLIAVEVASSVVLLVGAGLLLGSFIHLRSVQPGIEATGALSFKMSLPVATYQDDGKAARFISETVTRLQGIPVLAPRARPRGWRSRVTTGPVISSSKGDRTCGDASSGTKRSRLAI